MVRLLKLRRAHAAALAVLVAAVVGLAVALTLIRSSRAREDIRFEPAELGASSWVRIYDPTKASGGYTLVLYQRRIPMLIDMNGNIVHAWPEVRGRGRARLTKEGTLLVICTDKVIRELDWDGNLLWEFENDAGDDFPHHDLRRLRNGNTLLIYRDMDKGTDYFLEVDVAGEVVWDWRSSLHLAPFLSDENLNDRTHINSVQELPHNRWHEAGDRRFEPGNLLISARQLNAVFIIDKETGEPVWRYDRDLDYQHEALMIEKGHPAVQQRLPQPPAISQQLGDRDRPFRKLGALGVFRRVLLLADRRGRAEPAQRQRADHFEPRRPHLRGR